MLSKILEKLGVKDYSELKYAERQAYLQWAEVLTKPDLTIEDLKKILPVKKQEIIDELRKWENEPKKDLYLKATLRNLEMLTDIIITPEKAREELKKRLEKQFNL